MVRDVQLMRDFNFNCVRNSHYPCADRWYEICDAAGLYVVDEANIETHGMGFQPDRTLAADPTFEAAHVDRVRRTAERTKNHACVILWSLGNEAGNGPAFHRAYEWLKRRDPTRPVQYENAHEPGWDTNEIETIDGNTDLYVPMYPSPAKLEKYAEAREGDVGAPLIMCEYCTRWETRAAGWPSTGRRSTSTERCRSGCIWDLSTRGLRWRAVLARTSRTATAATLVRVARRRTRRSASMGLPAGSHAQPARVEAKYAQQPIEWRWTTRRAASAAPTTTSRTCASPTALTSPSCAMRSLRSGAKRRRRRVRLHGL